MNGEVQHFLELLWGMTEKELRARYKHTVFGFFWLVANPILQMAVIGFVFTFLLKQPVKNYYFFLFIGLLVWNFFSLSLSKATPSIVYERSLIKKARFPHAVIPISIILSNFVHFFLAFLLFLFPVLFLGTLSMLSLPIILFSFALLLTFAIGLSLLVTSLNVRFRDVNFFVSALLIIWFYATPIMYALTMIPRHLLWLWRFNPLTSILQLLQMAMLGLPGPGPAMLASNVGVIIITTILGIAVFTHESKNFDDWL
ncbi:ABC transporter permease [Candidatus Gottesmanbacteria bacterium]|nr:ABC transporter permease [Candidatus Gottesmanbacteria bacterium]